MNDICKTDGGRPQRLFLLGEHLSHSISSKIHGYLGCDYRLTEKSPDEADDFLRLRDFDGINVTIPYKKKALGFCGCLSDTAAECGSVNTVVNENGILHGYNTDVHGFLSLCEHANIKLSGAKILLLGDGGAAAAVRCAAKRAGARETVTLSRHGENTFESISLHRDSDIIVNATPVGMFPHCGEKIISLDGFSSLRGVVDLIYNPMRTPLIGEAKKADIPAACGLYMLVAQGVLANYLFTGITSDTDSLYRRILREQTSVIIEGMPGSGKSTVGKIVADRLGKEFTDTDDEIENIYNISPADIITEKGEGAFRDIEASVVKDALCRQGSVISLGGGAPMREENRPLFSQNGPVFYLRRELSQLDCGNRPLSSDIPALFEKRDPVYRSLCTYEIFNSSPDSAADEIIASFEKYLIKEA